MRVLLVGGNGYIGSELGRQLLLGGHRVTVASRTKIRTTNPNLEFVEWDATNEWAKETPSVDVIVHMASSNGDKNLGKLSDFLDNAAVTRNVIDLCSRIPECAMMYISTIQVFGSWNGRVDRNSPSEPRTDYALGHWIAEQQVNKFARVSARKTFIVRLGHAIGRGSNDSAIRWGTVPAVFCRQAVESQVIHLNSSGKQQRDFIDLIEAAKRLLLLLERRADWDGSTHILASGHGVSIIQVAETVSKVCSKVLRYSPPVVVAANSVSEESGTLDLSLDEWNGIELTGPGVAIDLQPAIESLVRASHERWGSTTSHQPSVSH